MQYRGIKTTKLERVSTERWNNYFGYKILNHKFNAAPYFTDLIKIVMDVNIVKTASNIYVEQWIIKSLKEKL